MLGQCWRLSLADPDGPSDQKNKNKNSQNSQNWRWISSKPPTRLEQMLAQCLVPFGTKIFFERNSFKEFPKISQKIKIKLN
jgi:hypothetical protein